LQSYGSKLCKPMGKVTEAFNHIVAVFAILWLKAHYGTLTTRCDRRKVTPAFVDVNWS